MAHEITTPNSTADVLAKTLRRPHCGPYPPSEPRDRPAVPPRREASPPKPVSGFPDGKVPMKLALHRSPRTDVLGATDIAVNTTAIVTRRFPGPRPISPKIGLVRRLPYDPPSRAPCLARTPRSNNLENFLSFSYGSTFPRGHRSPSSASRSRSDPTCTSDPPSLATRAAAATAVRVRVPSPHARGDKRWDLAHFQQEIAENVPPTFPRPQYMSLYKILAHQLFFHLLEIQHLENFLSFSRCVLGLLRLGLTADPSIVRSNHRLVCTRSEQSFKIFLSPGLVITYGPYVPTSVCPDLRGPDIRRS